MTRKIYLASSWRNKLYFNVLDALMAEGHAVYDFRKDGFQWQELDPEWRQWGPGQYLYHLRRPRARAHFRQDHAALDWADTCVLLLPCGRSAHLEAGYCIGKGKPTHVLLHRDQFEPELMYLLASGIHVALTDLIATLQIPIGVKDNERDRQNVG